MTHSWPSCIGTPIYHQRRAGSEHLATPTAFVAIVAHFAFTPSPIIENLPSFPDNISTGNAGRFWVAFVSPRNALLDGLSDQPFLRKMIQRLPAFLRPKAVAFGHIIAIDGNGSVVEDLQDPAGTYPINTSVTETPEYLYIGNLVASAVGRLSKEKAGL